MTDVAVSPPAQTKTVTIDVRGIPRPQGSMKLHNVNGHTAARYPAAVYQWRAQVQQAVADVMEANSIRFHEGPVEMRLGFELPRPAAHYLPVNKKRTAPELRADAPAWCSKAPDLDKLTRCIGDAITDAGLWKDDGQVAVIHAAKRYVNDGAPAGVLITIRELQ